MKKILLVALLTGAIVVSLVSCSPSSTNGENTKIEQTQNEENNTFIGQGEWAEDYTREEVISLNDEISERIEEKSNFYGLEYKKEEKFSEENGETISDKFIYFDNLNPEPNRMESMYYGFKTYGSDVSRGSLNLKIGFRLDLNQIKEEEKFDFKEISIAAFSEAMTNDTERDYTELNEKIIDIVKNQNANGTIETNLDGLVETITIKDEFLLYKLDSKTYDFKK